MEGPGKLTCAEVACTLFLQDTVTDYSCCNALCRKLSKPSEAAQVAKQSWSFRENLPWDNVGPPLSKGSPIMSFGARLFRIRAMIKQGPL